MGCGSSIKQIYEPETPGFKGQLIITVKHAILINDVNFLTTMDPYVVLKMDEKQEYTTPVHTNGGKYPKWEQATITFRKRVDKDDVITVSVFNKNLLVIDSLIGEGAFSLAPVRTGNNIAKEITLILYSKGQMAGTCSVDVLFILDPSGKDLPEITAPDTAGKLIVEPKCANLLEDTLLFKLDPFVTVRFGDESFSSAVHNDGHRSPKWTDEIQFERETDENTLYIEVWSFSDFGSNDLLGVAYASITDTLGLKEKIAKTCNLSFEGHPRGDVTIVVTFQTSEPQKYMKNQPEQKQNQPQLQQQQPNPLPQQLQQFATNVAKGIGAHFGGVQSGHVDYKYPNGDVYSGEVAGVFRSGSGKLVYAKGGYYQGQFSNDIFHGQGELVCGDSKYVGNFETGKKQGQGTETWANGQGFNGQWQYNSMHGEGEWTFPTGQKKKGVWANGNRVRWLDEDQSVIHQGKSLPQGFTIQSPSELFTLTLQYDGALAIFDNRTKQSIKKFDNFNRQIEGPFYLRLEPDGQLVLQEATGKPYYTSGEQNYIDHIIQQRQSQLPATFCLKTLGRWKIGDSRFL